MTPAAFDQRANGGRYFDYSVYTNTISYLYDITYMQIEFALM
jgi:hypothetical protein